MPQFRRGSAEIEKSTQRNSGGGFTPFAPSIYWSDDKEQKYLLFLNEIEDVPRLDMINFVPVKNKDGEQVAFTSVIARSDPCFEDEAYEDPMVKEWGAPIKDSNLFVAVELEAVTEKVRGRERPKSFAVKTIEFERRIRDADGDLTDDTETVTAPAYGFVQESASNFGAVIASHDATEAPIHEHPVKVQRIGVKTDTKYTIAGYPDMEIDLTPLFEHVDGISYLGEDADDLKEAIADLEGFEASTAIGKVLLEKRLNELADEERYNNLFGNIDKVFKYGSKDKKSSQKNGTKDKASRPSQRKEKEADEEAPAEKKPARGQKSESAMSALKELQASAAARKKS